MTQPDPAQLAAAAGLGVVGGPLGAVAAGQAVVSTYVNSGGTAQKASFSVDIDQIPGLLASYRDAQDQLSKIAVKASKLQSIGSPGDDEISKNMVKGLGKMASTNPGCLLEAVQDGIKRLQSQIEQLEKAAQEYRNSDETAKPTQV